MLIYEQGLCACGHPADLTEKKAPEQYWKIHSRVCQACAAIEIHRRDNSELHPAPNKHQPGKKQWDDGRTYYAEPVDNPYG